jgi:ABC-type sugar transport system substrate-binding protein
MKKRSLRLMLLVAAFPALSGCWYAAAAGAGAAVTYYAVENGYKAQSPVTHEMPDKRQSKE